MAIKSLNPYLTFDGTAEKAIQLYASALDAKTESLMRFGDAPGQAAPEHKDRVMHATLKVGGATIMMSDGMPGQPVPKQSNTAISLDFDDVADMTKKFDALAKGGKVTMPLQDTFWGARFGMLTDAYAVNWLFNCDLKK